MFAGPSAVGKTFIADELMRRYPGEFEQAKLYTTRLPRDGEIATDRIFLSEEEFEKKRKDGDFIVAEEFGGNWYGFTEESITPKGKHLLVNIWPWLAEQFSKLDHVLIIGMMPREDWEQLLVARMKSRGDTPETIEKRKKLIQKDINDLVDQRQYVEKSGKMFSIYDDQAIPEDIIPWIEEKLNL